MGNHLRDERQANVRDFHIRFSFAIDKRLEEHYHNADVDRELRVLGTELRERAGSFQERAELHQTAGDERLYRAHLLMEELGELFQSMGLRDEVLTADALSDLNYVVDGTAETFDISMIAVHREVHRSNMTKTRDPDDGRMRRKDPSRGYIRPNIRQAIERGRTDARR